MRRAISGFTRLRLYLRDTRLEDSHDAAVFIRQSLSENAIAADRLLERLGQQDHQTFTLQAGRVCNAIHSLKACRMACRPWAAVSARVGPRMTSPSLASMVGRAGRCASKSLQGRLLRAKGKSAKISSAARAVFESLACTVIACLRYGNNEVALCRSIACGRDLVKIRMARMIGNIC